MSGRNSVQTPPTPRSNPFATPLRLSRAPTDDERQLSSCFPITGQSELLSATRSDARTEALMQRLAARPRQRKFKSSRFTGGE